MLQTLSEEMAFHNVKFTKCFPLETDKFFYCNEIEPLCKNGYTIIKK